MPGPDRTRSRILWGALVLVLVLAMVAGIAMVRGATGMVSGFLRGSEPKITQALVLERLQEVARLVSSEMVLRDVVIYEQTRFRSTKRALLVVTGRVSAGINLRRAKVEIDQSAKRVIVTLPQAEIVSVEVLSMTTYDEQSGLLNPFTPEDRDLIQIRVRTQLKEAGRQSRILEHADASAAKALEALLRTDGFTVEVRRPLKPSARDEASR